MPISKSAIKEVRKTKKRYQINRSMIKRLKTITKKILSAKDKEVAKKLADSLVPAIQRAGAKNIIHRNKSARIISRITKHMNSLSKA